MLVAKQPSEQPSLPAALSRAGLAGQELVVGATKQYGLTAEEALQLCGKGVSQAQASEAARQLLPDMDPAAVVHGATIRSGVRAMPPRTEQGSLPLAGLLPESPASPR